MTQQGQAMTGPITFETASFVAAVVVAAFLIWWRIEGRVKEAKAEATLKADAAGAKADLVSAQLAEHKLHVAETYISKDGHDKSTAQVMSAIAAVRSEISGTNSRLDKLFDQRRGDPG